jgi:conjugal transfer/entry exclusion protein
MKQINKILVPRLAILLIAVFGIVGCASTGMQRSQDTQITLEAMDNDIQEISRQLDDTGASLDELMKPGQSDISRAFENYKNNVEEGGY